MRRGRPPARERGAAAAPSRIPVTPGPASREPGVHWVRQGAAWIPGRLFDLSGMTGAEQSVEAIAGYACLEHAIAEDASAPALAAGPGRHHQRNQVFLGRRRMALLRLRRVLPGGQPGFALGRRRLHRGRQPLVEGVRHRREAWVAIGAHVVEAHAATHDQDVLVT